MKIHHLHIFHYFPKQLYEITHSDYLKEFEKDLNNVNLFDEVC